jgi:hypothetical protein
MSRPRAALGWLMLAALGCTSRPHAPALTDDPVFQSESEGLKFVVPDGWTQFARSELPAGTITEPRLLVAYHPLRAETAAELELFRVDLPETADVAKYLTEHPLGPFRWANRPPPQELDINGQPATRHVFTRTAGRKEFTREVVAFRRGPRLYLFSASFATTDADARDHLRRSVQSVTWKG